MMDFTLNEIQMDALREIGNIGAGHAATALSEMRNRKVDMTVPFVNILPFEEMMYRVGKEDDMVIGVLLKVYGDAPGNILFLMNYGKAHEFTELFLKDFPDVSDEVYMSVFQELGNILGNSYLGAIADLTGLNFSTSVPGVAIDMLAAVLTTSFMDAEQIGDYVLAIDTKFLEEPNAAESQGSFFYIPNPGSLNTVLQRLGL